MCVCLFFFFFFKQKTAYEMRISDWSSDVCSSDLGASLRQLAHLHDWHISEAAYGEALGRLIDAHRAMPLAGLWGTGVSSSSDGQQFHAGGRGAAIGDINARNGNEPGVSFYTHKIGRAHV